MNQPTLTPRRGLAEQLGAIHPRRGGFGLSRNDIGMQIADYGAPEERPTDHAYAPLPPGHRFFQDCDREVNARKIEWMMSCKGVESWFVTLTFKSYISERLAFVKLGRWLFSLSKAYAAHADTGSNTLTWVCATEWQKRDVIHFHLVLSGVRLGALSRKRWELRWEAGKPEDPFPVEGFARIHDAVPGAAPYLAKYTSKGRGGALRWHLTSRGKTVPGAVLCCRA